jgi:ribulose-phosphate 3-epimerase
MTPRIAPSILAADFARLGEQVQAAERGGAALVHLDVMDGHFVPNLTIGPAVVKAVSRVTRLPLDVHLMLANSDRFLGVFAEAGAASIAVHVEAEPHLHRALQEIRRLGCKAGVALNPSTPVSALEEVTGELDYVIVMSVNPGFGGQAFIPRSESKVRAVRHLLDGAGRRDASIAVDGGVDLSNAARLVAAGVDILIAGVSIFGQADAAAATRALAAAAHGQGTA